MLGAQSNPPEGKVASMSEVYEWQHGVGGLSVNSVCNMNSLEMVEEPKSLQNKVLHGQLRCGGSMYLQVLEASIFKKTSEGPGVTRGKIRVSSSEAHTSKVVRGN